MISLLKQCLYQPTRTGAKKLIYPDGCGSYGECSKLSFIFVACFSPKLLVVCDYLDISDYLDLRLIEIKIIQFFIYSKSP